MRGCVARTRCIFRNSGCDLLRTGKPTIAGSRRSGQAGCGGRTGFAILAACPGEALRSLRGLFVRRARAGEDSLLNVLSYRGHKGAAQEFEFVEKFFNSLEEGGTDLTGVAVSRFGDFENPESPVLFSARFFPEGRGDI